MTGRPQWMTTNSFGKVGREEEDMKSYFIKKRNKTIWRQAMETMKVLSNAFGSRLDGSSPRKS